VALGTSSPELVVSGEAAFYGNSAIALGNVVGSNIGNIALILGIAALVCPMKARAEVVQREMPVMIGVTVLYGFCWPMANSDELTVSFCLPAASHNLLCLFRGAAQQESGS
jgi:cation:H+ antiporter